MTRFCSLTRRVLALGALALLSTRRLVREAKAHTRLECPPPRSSRTGEKVGPCDAADDPEALPPFPLRPGLNTVTWLESISHPGAAQRFALSLEGVDDGFESCVLLDHVPHDERSQPRFRDEATYHRTSVTLYVPDVRCERCHLQLLSVMSDDYHGLPAGESCAYEGAKTAGALDDASAADLSACRAVYHSCAPVSINGTVPRDEYTCSLGDFEKQLDWPNHEGVANKTPSVYAFKADPGLYDSESARLLSFGKPIQNCQNAAYCAPSSYYETLFTVPDGVRYASPHGTCAAATGAEVEPFQLGSVPGVATNDSEDTDVGSEQDEDENVENVDGDENVDNGGTNVNGDGNADNGIGDQSSEEGESNTSGSVNLLGRINSLTIFVLVSSCAMLL